MKIENYVIVATPNLEIMEKEVNGYIARGYQPYGDLAVAATENERITYVQPVVKYGEFVFGDKPI